MPANDFRLKGKQFGDPYLLRVIPSIALAAGGAALKFWVPIVLAGAVLFGFFLLTPLWIPVSVTSTNVQFWSGWRYRRIARGNILPVFGTPLMSNGGQSRAVLVLVDVVRGKAFRVASVMMDSKASLLLHAVAPLADALDRPGPAILPWVFLEAGLAGPPPYSMSIGGQLVEGQRLKTAVVRHFFRCEVEASNWIVGSVSPVDHPNRRMLRVDLTGSSPKTKAISILFE
jgi:hypothetical protein